MRKIYAFGEIILDIIFENNQPVVAKVGGSALNSAVSLGRLDLPISFISEFGADKVGDISDAFLKENGVSTQYIKRCQEGKSPLALAFLDENRNAEYCFYKMYPEKRLHFDIPDFQADDLFLFGSFYAIDTQIRPQVKNLLEKVKSKNAIICYDPNFRKSRHKDLHIFKPIILENIQFADIVRGSDEDFEGIFGTTNADDTYKEISKYCKNLVYTANSKFVSVRTPNVSLDMPTQKIQPVSTIGAGDTFNAGIIYSLLKNKISHFHINEITDNQWDTIISTSINFSTNVCLSLDNYISKEFANNYKF